MIKIFKRVSWPWPCPFQGNFSPRGEPAILDLFA